MSKQCEKCGAELTPKDWGQGGIVQNDASGRIHGPEQCLERRLDSAKALALAISDIAGARLEERSRGDTNVHHDLSEIHRLANEILK